MRVGAALLSGLAALLIIAVLTAPFGWLAGLGLPLEGGWPMVLTSRPAHLFQALLLILIWWPSRGNWRAGLLTALAAGSVLLWPATIEEPAFADLFAALSWGPVSLPLIYLAAKSGLGERAGEMDPGLGRFRRWVLMLTAAGMVLSIAAIFYPYAVGPLKPERLFPEEMLLTLAMFVPLSVFVYFLLRVGEPRPIFMALAGVGALMGLGGWLWLGFDLIPVQGEPDLMIIGWLAIEVLTIQMLSWAAIAVSLIILGRGLAFKTSWVPGSGFRPTRALLLAALAAGAGLAVMALWVWQTSLIHYDRQPVTQALRTLRVGDLSIKIPEPTDRIIWNTNIHRPADQAGPPLQLLEFFFEESDPGDSQFEKILDKERSTSLTPSSGRISWEDVSHLFDRPAHLITKPYRPSNLPVAEGAKEARLTLLLHLPEGYLKLNEATWWQPDEEVKVAAPEARRDEFLAFAQKIIAAYQWEGPSAGRPDAGFKTKYGHLDSSRLPGAPEATFIAVWSKNERKYNFEVRINPARGFVAHRPPIFSDRLKVVIGDAMDYRVKSVKGLPGHERIDILGSYGSGIIYLLLKWADSGPVQGSYAPSLSLGLAGGTGNEAPELAEILSLWEALLDGVRAAGKPENN